MRLLLRNWKAVFLCCTKGASLRTMRGIRSESALVWMETVISTLPIIRTETVVLHCTKDHLRNLWTEVLGFWPPVVLDFRDGQSTPHYCCLNIRQSGSGRPMESVTPLIGSVCGWSSTKVVVFNL